MKGRLCGLGKRFTFLLLFVLISTNLFALKPKKYPYDSTKEDLVSTPYISKLLKTLGFKALMRENGDVSILYDLNIPLDITTDKSNVKKSIESFLNKNKFLFFTSTNPMKFLDLQKESISNTGRNYFFRQKFDGIDIENGGILIHVGKSGVINLITNNIFRNITQLEGGGIMKISQTEAISIAKKNLENLSLRGNIEAKEVVLENNDNFYRSYKVSIPQRNPDRDLIFYINTTNGEVIKKEDILRRIEPPCGDIFYPNKIVSSVMERVALPNLFNKDILSGKFVFVKNSIYGNVIEPSGLFFFPDLFTNPSPNTQDHLVEVMAYYHIDNYHNYLASLDINILNYPSIVDAGYSMSDDSFFSPVTKSIYFGLGGVQDAYDADIILHEYVHAVEEAILPDSLNSSGEPSAISEAIADYLSASFFGNDCIGEWDSIVYSSSGCLRKLQNDKKYPTDLVFEVHEDSLILSGTLWKIRREVSNNGIDEESVRKFDSIVLNSLYFLLTQSSFREVGIAIVEADKMVTDGAWERIIKNGFYQSGIFEAGIFEAGILEENNSD